MTNIKKNIFKIICLSILVLNAQMFMLPIVSHKLLLINTYHNKILITILCIFLFIFWIISHQKSVKLDTGDIFVLILILIQLILFVIQIISTDESIIALFSNYYYNLILLAYFPLKSWLRNKENLVYFIKIYIFLGLIYSISIILYYYFFQNYVLQNELTLVQEVNGIIRFPQTSDLIGSVVLFIILAKSLKIISQFKMIVYATLCMFCLLFISNVRMVTLISIIILIYFFYSLQLNRKNSYIKIICSILIIIGICIITIQFGLIERFIGVGQQQASVFYRFNVIDYYRNHFLDNLIFGFGYSSSVKTLYNYTDIGMLGFIYRYGIIGLMWVICIILYFYKGNKNSIINKTIFIYFLGMAISLSLFDPQRILYFPILFSIYTNFVDRREIF